MGFVSVVRSVGEFFLVVVLAVGITAAAFATLSGIYLAGVMVPRFLIGNGVDRFQGEKREMAQSIYEGTADFSEDALFVSAYRVESVKKCPGAQPMPNSDFPPEVAKRKPFLSPEASGEVRVYAIFGVPADTIRVRCNER